MKPVRLKSLVREIARQHPEGLRHAEFVTEILHSGYVHQEGNLSVSVQQVIKRLVTEGVLQLKSEEDSREYQIAVA